MPTGNYILTILVSAKLKWLRGDLQSEFVGRERGPGVLAGITMN